MGRHITKMPASACQSETLPQPCNVTASGQQWTRRLCQHMRHGPGDRQLERWHAANMGTDQL